MKHVVIVGGGIAGLTAALVLAGRNCRVTLVEKGDQIGGLLGSTRFGEQGEFDFGTHFASETGIPELDRLLFGEQTDMQFFDRLNPATFFQGRLGEGSSSIDLRDLPEAEYAKGLAEMLVAEEVTQPDTLATELGGRFGVTWREAVFAPIMKKFFGLAPDELSPGAGGYFGLSRVRILDPAATRELKLSSRYDSRIAFHEAHEGRPSLRAAYPRGAGLGNWIAELEVKIRAAGVEIVTGRAVSRVLHKDGAVDAIVMGKDELPCDHVVWSIAPYFLLVLARLPHESKRPELLRTSLHHYEFDRPFKSGSHYVTCYDPAFRSFRVTLYPNFCSVECGRYTVTVEVLHRELANLDDLTGKLVAELKGMGLVAEDAGLKWSTSDVVAEGFPIPTSDFMRLRNEQSDQAMNAFVNVSLVGRAKGDCFFLSDVIRDAFEGASSLVL